MDDGRWPWVKSIVLDNELYMSSPSAFNDPFDCFPYWAKETSEAMLVSFYMDLYRIKDMYGDDISRLQRALTMARKIRAGDAIATGVLNEAFDGLQASIGRNTRVACFNADPFHQLMWAHYGGSHTGVCIQFNRASEMFKRVHKVNYSKLRLEVNVFEHNRREVFERSLLTKSDAWAYETEWRLISMRLKDTFQMPNDAISGVIVGARASPETVARIEEWTSARKVPVPVLRARLLPHSYDIEVPGLPT